MAQSCISKKSSRKRKRESECNISSRNHLPIPAGEPEALHPPLAEEEAMHPDLDEDNEDIQNWSEQELPEEKESRLIDKSPEGHKKISASSAPRTWTPESKIISENVEACKRNACSDRVCKGMGMPNLCSFSSTWTTTGKHHETQTIWFQSDHRNGY